MVDSTNQDEWSAYWRDGRGAACRGDDAGLYRGAIGSLWRDWFAALPASVRVLDLATGNGAVMEIGLSVAETRANDCQWQLYGVDRAQIAPRRNGSGESDHCRLRFLSGVSNEALPFAASMFDRVCSQYGAEYGDFENTVAEAARVLRPAGELFWVCHWREGTIARSAAAEVDDALYFEQLALPARMLALIQRQQADGRFMPNSHQATAATPQRKALQDGLNAAFERLRQRGHGEDSNLTLFLHNLAHLYQLREQHAVSLVTEKLQQCEQELIFHRRRLQALVAAALDEQRLQCLLSVMGGRGFTVTSHGVVREVDEGKDVAYQIKASWHE
ncbi:MAG: hypothetical protein Tsb002_17210 [Wenzhouxiangellaceae bacterium]